ncbi:transmembrane channel-like protein 5 [Trichonephila clavipes]|nr:transmembrane channel-like protein 5 [Trichonephila clavipes]
MATSGKFPVEDDEEQKKNTFHDFHDQLDEDEYGYVDTKGKKASSTLLRQLPSRHLDDILVTDVAVDDKKSYSLRRKDSHYRKVRLRNASLNYHNVSVGAHKIYEILNADPDIDEAGKMKTLREMHQSLTIKRQVKELLDAAKERKIATKALSYWTRFKLAFFMVIIYE